MLLQQTGIGAAAVRWGLWQRNEWQVNESRKTIPLPLIPLPQKLAVRANQ
jgi:hypothetical protein